MANSYSKQVQAARAEAKEQAEAHEAATLKAEFSFQARLAEVTTAAQRTQRKPTKAGAGANLVVAFQRKLKGVTGSTMHDAKYGRTECVRLVEIALTMICTVQSAVSLPISLPISSVSPWRARFGVKLNAESSCLFARPRGVQQVKSTPIRKK